MKTETKRLLKRIIIALIIIFVVLVVAILALVYSALPSPHEIAKKLGPKSSAVETQEKHKNSELAVETAKGDSPEESGQVTELDAKAAKKAQMDMILKDMTNVDRGYSHVCEALGKGSKLLPTHQGPIPAKGFNKVYADGLSQDQRDPLIESILPSLRLIFSYDSFKNLFQMIEEAQKNNTDDSWTKKADFYAAVYKTYVEMKSKTSEIEEALDRSYLLAMMSRVAEKNPSFMQSAQARAYCEEIEKALNRREPYQVTEESAEFMSFLEAAEVRPEEIGYDPKQKTKLQFEYNEGSLKLRSTWLDQIFSEASEPPDEKKGH